VSILRSFIKHFDIKWTIGLNYETPDIIISCTCIRF